MTTPTESQKRVLIARACGVEPVVTWKQEGLQWVIVEGTEDWTDAPEYFHDLHACSAMRKALTQKQRTLFAERLGNMIADQESVMPFYEKVFQILDATPSQQAEAFGRTLNLWT